MLFWFDIEKENTVQPFFFLVVILKQLSWTTKQWTVDFGQSVILNSTPKIFCWLNWGRMIFWIGVGSDTLQMEKIYMLWQEQGGEGTWVVTFIPVTEKCYMQWENNIWESVRNCGEMFSFRSLPFPWLIALYHNPSSPQTWGYQWKICEDGKSCLSPENRIIKVWSSGLLTRQTIYTFKTFSNNCVGNYFSLTRTETI